MMLLPQLLQRKPVQQRQLRLTLQVRVAPGRSWGQLLLRRGRLPLRGVWLLLRRGQGMAVQMLTCQQGTWGSLLAQAATVPPPAGEGKDDCWAGAPGEPLPC